MSCWLDSSRSAPDHFLASAPGPPKVFLCAQKQAYMNIISLMSLWKSWSLSFSCIHWSLYDSLAGRSSRQLWKARGTPAVTENDCSQSRALTCDLAVASSLPVQHWSHGAEGKRLSPDKTNKCFILCSLPLKTYNTTLKDEPETQYHLINLPDAGLQWEKQADSKWILIFPAVHCRWFLAEWLHSCRIVRGWTV